MTKYNIVERYLASRNAWKVNWSPCQTRAWDNGKIWVPRQKSNPWTPELWVGRSIHLATKTHGELSHLTEFCRLFVVQIIQGRIFNPCQFLSQTFLTAITFMVWFGSLAAKKEARKGGTMSSSQEDESSWASSMEARVKHKGLVRVRTWIGAFCNSLQTNQTMIVR